MQTEVMFAGFGGQGILLSAKILAHAAMDKGYEVVWIPSYGPEMRGGTAYCTVVISDRPIGSPIIKNPQHLIAMNRPSFLKFAPTVKASGTILINSSLISDRSGRSDIEEIVVPVTDIANDLGSIRSANIVALSAFVAKSQILPWECVRDCIRLEFNEKKDFLDVNMQATEEGKKAVLSL